MSVCRILLNGSFAPSVVNFRGPLIEDMIAQGYEVHVAVPDVTQSDRAQINALGAVVHEVPLQRAGTNLMADWRYFQSMKRLIAHLRPHLVLNYTIKPNIWGSLAAKSYRVASASMVTGLGYTFIQTETMKQRLIASASRWLYRRASAANQVVIFQNPDDREDFIEAGCLDDPSKARLVAGSGVDIEHFVPVPMPQEPVFLMIARLLVSKGVREYAKAAQTILAQGGNQSRFLLAGNLDATPDCIDPVELAEWQDAGIEYLGWSEDVRKALGEASVYVLPSYREGTPRTVLEAAAMGRPCITTDSPGCRETVIHGETGTLVPVRNSESLVDAMQALAANPALRVEMGRNARQFCEKKYAVRTVNRALMNHLGLVKESHLP